MKVLQLLALLIIPTLSAAQGNEDVFLIRQNSISATPTGIPLPAIWSYGAGDNFSWTELSFDDSNWQKVETRLSPGIIEDVDLQDIVWFRLRVKVDSSLVNRPLGLVFSLHNGASELYINGDLVLEQGLVSRFDDSYEAYHNPNPASFIFTDTTEHVIAIRYNNHRIGEFHKANHDAGFAVSVVDLNDYLSSTSGSGTAVIEDIYVAAISIFALIHFLLFVFYPSEKRNLLLAFIAIGMALFAYALHPLEYTRNPNAILTFHTIGILSWYGAMMITIHFFQSFIYEKTPLYFWVIAALGIVVVLIDLANIGITPESRLVFDIIAVAELAHMLLLINKKKQQGISPLIIAVLGLVGFGIFYTLSFSGGLPVYPLLSSHYGTFILVVGISVYLSSSFAKAQKKLEYKLLEVQYLSDRSLEQERTNKKKEIENKLLEIENDRKSEELEEARTLQLSMLPKQIPEHESFEIAAFMDTAQEVGGDYYDFSMSQEGVLTAVLGDATGHGMKAGILVATAKSYFHTLVGNNGNIDIIKKMSSGIQNMNLKMMYMGLTIAKCEGHSITYTSAGMPPSLLFRKTENTVEEVVVKAMPLGTQVDFPHKEIHFDVQKGDVLLLISDGLMELFNKDREQLGMDRIGEALKTNAHLSSDAILHAIKGVMNDWLGECRHEDDVTIMVLKAK